MRNYRRALASADLRRLFAALVTSATGTWAYNVALLAWVYSRTHSLGWVGAAGVLRMLPSLILSVSAGVLAERTERIRLMVGCNLACMVSQLLLAGVVAAGLSPVFGILCAVLTSAFSTPNEPAVAATIPSLAGADELAAANALNSSIEQLVVIAGPAVGALLLALGSATVVFLINAASFAAAAVIVSRIRTRSRPVDVTEGGTAGVGRQLAAGFRAIAAQRAARLLVAYCVLVTFLYGSDTVLFIDASVRHLGTGADGWGYLLAGLGVGGLLAALVVDRFAEAPRLGLVILSGALGY
jgi:MFS family permease